MAAVVLLAPSCGGFDEAIPTVSLPPPAGGTGPSGATGVTVSPSGTVTPTSSPGATGSVTQGTASLSLSGGVNATVTFASLASPAVWTPPPGSIALSWNGPGDQVLTLSGPSFTSQISTDAAHTLAFTVTADGTPVQFLSSAGECTVAISPALPTQIGGTFLCTNLSSTDDGVTVNAQGTFSATG